LTIIRNNLSSIVKVTQGTASVTPELEEVMYALSQFKVPRLWGTAYPSLKPLGSWISDLNERIQFYANWVEDKLPEIWWLPALTYPTSFLTAILQVAARSSGVSIDSLSFETIVISTRDKNVKGYPKEGVYITGILLEGATWDEEGGHLKDSKPMELISTMPIIHFKPSEGKKKNQKGYYTCPMYMYPVRSGTRERPSYVTSIDVKTGPNMTAEKWTKRGVAMLLSTNT
jgi:dynein heavy chain